jgi:hypothetical protein
VPILERLSPNAWVEMNHATRGSCVLKPQEQGGLWCRGRGSVRAVELRVTENGGAWQIFVAPSTTVGGQNAVTIDDVRLSARLTFSGASPISYKQGSAVRVERLSSRGVATRNEEDSWFVSRQRAWRG